MLTTTVSASALLTSYSRPEKILLQPAAQPIRIVPGFTHMDWGCMAVPLSFPTDSIRTPSLSRWFKRR
jgi:hypothetical protein